MKKIITIIFVIAFVAISGYFIYLDISQIETLLIPNEKCSDLLGVSPKTFVKTQGYDTFFEKRYRYAKVDDNGNFQPLKFDGTTASADGEPQVVENYYSWNGEEK